MLLNLAKSEPATMFGRCDEGFSFTPINCRTLTSIVHP
jgi:hypothetical protein